MKDGFMKTGGYTAPGKLWGLGGELRAGKDAVADHLVEEHGFVKMGMSDVLNDALLKLNPLIAVPGGRENFSIFQRYSELHDRVGYVEAKKNPEVRRLLQVLGTEVGRDMIHPDVWVRMAEARIRDHWANGKDVVITAMRFPNELDMLKRLGGKSLWVARSAEKRLGEVGTPGNGVSDVLGASQGVTGGVTAHASENSVKRDDFTYQIHNEGTLDQLHSMVDMLIFSVGDEAPRIADDPYEGSPRGEKIISDDGASYFEPGTRLDRLKESFAPPYDR